MQTTERDEERRTRRSGQSLIQTSVHSVIPTAPLLHSLALSRSRAPLRSPFTQQLWRSGELLSHEKRPDPSSRNALSWLPRRVRGGEQAWAEILGGCGRMDGSSFGCRERRH